MNILKDQRGMTALLTVVIILIMILGLGLVVSQFSINEMVLTGEARESEQASTLLTACMNEATYRYKKNTNFSGGVLQIEEGSCQMAMTGVGEEKTITVTATVGRETRVAHATVRYASNAQGLADGIEMLTWYEN